MTKASLTFSDTRPGFTGEVAKVVDRFKVIAARGDDDFSSLDSFDDFVFLKNTLGVVVYANNGLDDICNKAQSPIGRTTETLVDENLIPIVQAQDQLIMMGCSYIDCEHFGSSHNGHTYRLRVHKRSLRDFASPGLAILGVVRVQERLSLVATPPTLELATAYRNFLSLDERDREICRLTVLGATSRDLAKQYEMTPRGIELRKQKALAALGVEKTAELVRLLVRLQDHGYVDLGL